MKGYSKMKIKNVPYFKTSLKIDNNIKKSAETGWLTTGPMVKQFESEISEYTGAKYVVAVNSCTAGLHLALAAQDIKRGDYVIVPNLTFVATSEVVEYFGAKVVLCDIDPKTLCIDVNQVESIAKKLKNKLKFVMPVHFGGYAADMKSLLKLSRRYGFIIIEDCAHALETVSNVGKVGNSDHCSVFSFYANKNLTTGGEGGAVATNNKNLAEKIRKLSLHGMSKSAWSRFSDKGKWYYEVDSLGYKYNLTDIAAGFGLQQIKNIDALNEKRQSIAKKYNKVFDKIPGVSRFHYDNKYKNARHLYIVHLDKNFWSISRDEFIDKLNELGVGTSVHYIPLHKMPYYKNKYKLKDSDFPKSCSYFEGCISLPMYPSLTNGDISFIEKVFLRIYNEYKND